MGNFSKEGSGSVRVLLIPPLLERNYETFFKHFKPDFKKVFTFYMIKPIPRHERGTVNYPKLLEHCCKIIKDEDIGVLFANKQSGALVCAVLRKEFPNIRGPTAESVFLCSHDYYKASVIDSREHKIPHSLYILRGDRYDFAHKVLTTMKPPCIMRSCLGVGHSTYCFDNRDQLLHITDRCRLDTEHIIGMHRYLIENYIDLKKYPMATAQAVLVSSVPDTSSVHRTEVHVEVCVFQGEVIPWSISELLKLPYGENLKLPDRVFAGVKMPCSLSEELQGKLWGEVRKDVKNLVKHGFDYSFMHSEYNVYDDGYIHLATMCVGPNANNTKMYAEALEMGNNMEAALQVSMGIRPQKPRLKLNEEVILNHLMLVFQSGKADSLIRFSKAMSNPSVWLRYLPSQDIVIEPAKSHAIVGSIVAKGKDITECLEKIKSLRTINLKIPEHVPLSL